MFDSLLRRAGFVLALLACSLASMTVSFYLVRHLARREYGLETATPRQVREASELRRLSNNLVRLTRDFLHRVPPHGSEEHHAWIAHEFRPRLDAYRMVLLDSSLDGPLLGRLVDAADALTRMVHTPNNAAYRQQAAQRVKAAQAAVEKLIQQLGVGREMEQPPLMPGF